MKPNDRDGSVPIGDEQDCCPHCKMDKKIRNPSGFCDHLKYPENCPVCMRRELARQKETIELMLKEKEL